MGEHVMAMLTVRAVKAAQPKLSRTGQLVRAEYPDAACPGLYLLVEPTGARSWALRYRRPSDRKTAKLTLGKATEDGLTLAAARHAAAAARLRLERGEDPSGRRQVKTAAPAYRYEIGDSVAAWVGSFLELHARRKNRASTVEAAERIFNLVLTAWRGRSIDSIRRGDVIELIERIAADRPCLANRTLSVLSKFFNWLKSRDRLAVSPADGVARPHQEKARQRILTDAELKALWIACEGDGPFGQALRLLALTGARRNEVTELVWSEIDKSRGVWTLPPARAKNHREHVITLSSQAMAIIESMPRFAGCPFIFSADGRAPVVGWTKAKKRISAKAGIVEKSWRLHDLRRTCASGMQKLGVSVPVIEKCLNHVSGTFRGIVGTYQQHGYADEIAIALQKWGDHVERLVGGKPAKVIRLRRK
jgi:integrase